MPQWDLSALSPAMARAADFLRDTLPLSDLDSYPFAYFRACAEHALMVRAQFPWCAALDEELFFHYVLCPRVNDEDLSDHRSLFFSLLRPRVEGLAVEEAVLAVNRWCNEQASYQLQDDRTASPLTVFRNGSGRCGEESAFLVAALRSVGIPARQVYAPRWAHCDDNHAWVEALCGDRWHFLGACEPEPELDRGWFNTAAGRALLVHSRTFGRGTSPLHGPFLEQRGTVCWYNQTGRYTETRRYTLQALCGGRPAPGTQFRIQVLNEAQYHTIVSLTAGPDGRAQVCLGLGDFHVEARREGLEARGDCAGSSLTLELAAPPPPGEGWDSFDVHAPRGRADLPPPLTPEQKERRAAVRAAGSRSRRERAAGWCVSGAAGCQDLLRRARGNARELAAFLRGPEAPLREQLVRTLTDKDLRDVTCSVLEEHFSRRPPRSADMPEEVYWSALCCPRIALEPLTPWRGPLGEGWTAEERARVQDNPRCLPVLLARRVRPEGGQIYENLRWPPQAALAAGRCDGLSFGLLCTAQLRALGVPARLRALDGRPEFWRDGAFRPLEPEETARLTLTRTPEETFRYGQNWGLSRWTARGWTPLAVTGGWQGTACTLTLPAGRFRLITTVRLPSGNQLAARRELTLEAGADKTLPLYLRTFDLEDLLMDQPLPPVPAAALTGEPVRDAVRTGRPALLLWLEEGGEPTEHVLHELAASRGALAALPVDVRFFLRSREAADHPALVRLTADGGPEMQLLLDDWAFDLEGAARRLGLEPDRPPLCVVCTGDGRARYGVSGYRVGSVELLCRICRRLFEKEGEIACHEGNH